jgi:hypothetical protein
MGGEAAGDAVAVEFLVDPPFEHPRHPRAALGIGDEAGAGGAHGRFQRVGVDGQGGVVDDEAVSRVGGEDALVCWPP